MLKVIFVSIFALLLLIIADNSPINSQDDPSPRFGRVAYLGTDDTEYSSVALSPDGQLLVANASRLLPAETDGAEGKGVLCWA